MQVEQPCAAAGSPQGLGTHTPVLTVPLRCQVDNEQHGAGWRILGDVCQEMSLPSVCLHSQGPHLAVNGRENWENSRLVRAKILTVNIKDQDREREREKEREGKGDSDR